MLPAAPLHSENTNPAVPPVDPAMAWVTAAVVPYVSNTPVLCPTHPAKKTRATSSVGDATVVGVVEAVVVVTRVVGAATVVVVDGSVETVVEVVEVVEVVSLACDELLEHAARANIVTMTRAAARLVLMGRAQ